jgi:hypothetical protein
VTGAAADAAPRLDARIEQDAATLNSGQRVLAVTWNEDGNQVGVLRTMNALPPWEFQTPPLEIGADSVLRYAFGRIYAVSRADGTITAVDPDTWTPSDVYVLGADSGPADIAVVNPELAYVSRRPATHLLRLNLITGASEEVVDLAAFADDDGVPDMEIMAMHEGRLFVQIRRVDWDGFAFVPPAYIAVVDIASEQLIDVDPDTPGVQAIELEGMAPKLKMQIVRPMRRLFVSASGDYFDAGGMEMIDLDTLQSLGFGISEAEDIGGPDLGPFVMVTTDRGYLAFSTDFAVSTHLVGFSLSGGIDPGPALYETVGYFAPTLELDVRSNTFFLPVGGTGGQGVHVFDAGTGARLTSEVIAAGGPPTDVVLVCPGFDNCEDFRAIPTMSAWGLAVMTLALFACGTVILTRRRRPGATGPGAPGPASVV